ncbi:MAG TPA: DNA alkylation repair protein [Candidatus Saccharimonadales bacterium]|nr:DNA alkylation repair protein [Candidatus Saccharimonadales bacterium]
MTAAEVTKALRAHASAEDAVFLQRFFKTGEGEYGAGDVFIGVRVPATRAVCKQFKELPLTEIQKLLDSNVHEYRLAALILLGNKYAKADPATQKQIYTLYLQNVAAGRVNNWDLVDSSAELIVGPYLEDRPREPLARLAKSDNLWQKRVAMVSTFYYLKHGDPVTTIEIAEILLHDPNDLIQKAVGWMLREMGKKVDEEVLIDFLEKHAATMPRTMLRYAIERLSPTQKAHFMAVK